MPHDDRPPVTIGPGSTGTIAGDVLGGTAPSRRSRSWRAALTAAIGVSGIAVAATGIALAVALSGGGPQPEDVLPADAFAMVKLDLDPAGGQKLAAYKLTRRFPDLEVGSARKLSDDLLRQVVADDDDVDYDAEIEPWIGDRGALAALPDVDGDGEPEALVAIAYDDRRAAERLLPALVAEPVDGERFFFAFSERGPYVLLAASQKTADAVARSKQVLVDAEDFRADVAELDGDQVALAWADLAALWSNLPDEVRQDAVTAQGEDFSLTGRAVMGVRLEDDAVHISGRSFGVDLGNDALTSYALGAESGGGLVADLPADTVAAVSVAGLGRQVQDLLSAAEPGLGGPEDLDALGAQFGLEIPEDLVVLLGQETAIGVYEGADRPQFGIRTRDADPARGLEIAQRLLRSLADQPSDVGQVAALPDGLAYGSTPEVLDKLTGSRDLGQIERFREAVPDADSAATAVFVDLQAALVMLDEQRPGLRALDALGLSSRGGPDGRFEIRLTLR